MSQSTRPSRSRQLLAEWAAEDAYLREIFGLSAEDVGTQTLPTESFARWTPVRRGPPRAVALSAWRRELQRGQRTKTTFDALWAAASAEQQALEHDAAGLPEIAARFWGAARTCLLKSAGSAAA
jgi:hypothetical protein